MPETSARKAVKKGGKEERFDKSKIALMGSSHKDS
jgi:hypothetical protein